VITLSGAAREVSGGMHLEVHCAGLGGTATHFIQTFKKRVFQQKFMPNYA